MPPGKSIRRPPPFVNLSFWICLLMTGATIQYLPEAISETLKGRKIWWSIDISGASPIQSIIKDALLLLFSINWIIIIRYKPKQTAIFASWILLITLSGLVPYTMGYGEPIFIQAGLRWILLLSGGGGLFLLSQILPWEKYQQKILATFLFIDAAICCILTLLQIKSFGSIIQARAPSAFAVAGTAGYFSFSAILLTLMLKDYKASTRLTLQTMFLLVAIGSGTRFAILADMLVMSYTFSEFLKNISTKMQRVTIYSFTIPPFLTTAYYAVFVLTNRGGISEQFGDKSRYSNLMNLNNLFDHMSASEFLFGHGLGMSTNTAINIAQANKITDPWLLYMDNSFATTFLQMGIVGSIILWTFTISSLAIFARRCQLVVIASLCIFTFIQNVFEQYAIIICACTYFGYAMRSRTPPQSQNNPSATPRQGRAAAQ